MTGAGTLDGERLGAIRADADEGDGSIAEFGETGEIGLSLARWPQTAT